MRVLPANSSDLESIYQLIVDLSAWLKSKEIDQWSSPYPRDALRLEIEAGEVFIIREEGILIGSVTLNSRTDPYWKESNEKAFYLHRLAVPRSHSGKGIGRFLLSWAEENLRKQKISILRLDCAATNEHLQSYYKSLGFIYQGESFYEPYNMKFALFEKRL